MKTLEFEINIAASKEQLWSAWTSNENVAGWFAPIANIEPKVGGAFELFFDPSNREHMTTKGCKFLELVPMERLSFQWKGPDDFAQIMNEDHLTIVNVTFTEDNKTTTVKVFHSGWGTGDEWSKAVKWHEFAWKQVLGSLKDYVESDHGNLCCGN